ncbi:4239_t:CDS:1, partial [Scutellospora calospora]
RLGLCYRNGVGTLKNQEKAIKWLLKAKNKFQEIDYRENPNIDNFLKQLLIENNLTITWIPFSELNIIEKIGKGGFSTVYAALWTHSFNDAKREMFVALKFFNETKNAKNSCEELLKEVNN